MNKTARGVISALSGGICWAFSGICGQYLFREKGLEPEILTLIRLIAAGLILIAVSALKDDKKTFSVFKSRKNTIRLCLFGIMGMMFCQYTYFKAIALSNASTATILQYLGPVLVMLVVCVMQGRKPRLFEALSLLLAVSGVFILSTGGKLSSLIISPEALFFGLMAALGVVFYTLLPKGLIEEYGTIPILGFGMLIGGVFFLAVLHPGSLGITLDVPTFLAFLGVIIVGTAFAYTIYLHSVKCIGAIKASLIASVEPVAATVMTVLVLKTPFSLTDLFGIVLILSAVTLLSLKK